MQKVLVGVVMTVVGIVAAVVAMGVVAHNSDVSLRNAFAAQQKSNESSFDKAWKTIQQNAEIASTERESFRKTYVEIMEAQRGVAGNGQLASFFTQAGVNVSPELFSKLMTTIEAQRESFHRDQQHLLKIKQQHDDVRTRMPSALFVGSRPPLEAQIVTSARTGAAFSTGADDDVKLFGDKK